MVGPLLQTKLHVPRRASGLVVRPRLGDRLATVDQSPLTVVSAPAGFGKTTLLAEWLPPSGVWLSLDERDNDPAVFWRYVLAAIGKAANGVGADALSLLQPPQAPFDAFLATLLNDLDTWTEDIILVLDDFHVIESADLRTGLSSLLEHLPQQLHLVIATRADPDLPLARLRARGQLVEVRAADLRFTLEESAAYLNNAMGLELTAPDIAALDARTEGWIAALQLAALSMQGRNDRASFIAGFAGDDRYVVDYLVEEVLQRQTDQVRGFLLQTCILDRLSGPLCDAVTGGSGGKTMLTSLDHDNLFVAPLDDRRQWYRYHHLFAEVLHAHLLDEQPDTVGELHHRASEWYAHNGEPLEAITHALAAEDLDRAADLMELAIPGMRRTRQEAAMRAWVDVLPDHVVRVRPVLNIGLVGALAASGEFDDIERRLQNAERWLGPRDADAVAEEMVVVDEEEFRLLPAEIAMYRSGQALVAGDLAATAAHARQAILSSPDGDHLPRAGGTALLGLASWMTGDLAAADRAYDQSMAMLRRTGYESDALGCATGLADIQLAQGRLGDAMRTLERALAEAQANGRLVRGTADLHVGMSKLHLERNDLDAARRHLVQSQALGEQAGLPRNRHRCRVALARLREAEGELDEALDLLDEAERVYTADFFPDVRPIPAMRARMQVRGGRVGEALGWAREQGLSPDDDLSYLREFEHITLAMVMMARGMNEGGASTAAVVGFLERLLSAAQEGQRTGSIIQILVLTAVARQTLGDRTIAADSLRRAVSLAEPEGYVRVFVEQGKPLAPLLRALPKQGAAYRYPQSLVAAMNGNGHVGPAGEVLIDPLSERELEVLRLLTTDLDGPDIARELVVSLNTIRTHTKHIYTKLGVNNRRAAVRRATELDLLSRQ